MKWRDFFYFSTGERRSLILLLCLITIAGILLIMKDSKPAQEETREPETAKSENVQAASDSSSAPAAPVDAAPRKTPPSTTTSRKNNTSETAKNSETVPVRAKRISSYSSPSYPRSEKFKEGVVVELNSADTTTLKKVPGIGSSFAKRIVGYRNLLGGYYSVSQLSEIYGMDEEHYQALAPWFTVDPSLVAKIAVNDSSHDNNIRRHPYLNKEQRKVIFQLRRQKGKLSGWENLQLLSEFTDSDRQRLERYLSFE